MSFTVFLVIFFTFSSVNNFYLPTVDMDMEKAEEVQNAICSIATKEIEATANSTITRQLKGVCTSNELNLKIDKLQRKILQEIDSIRYILETNGFKLPSVEYDGHLNYRQGFAESLITDDPKNAVPIFDKSSSSRMEELLTYNDSVVDTSEGDKYYYYWKIDGIKELLAKSDMYKSSPDFSILGHTMHLQFYPNYIEHGDFAMILKPDSAGFVKKHRFTILNQQNAGLDIVSKILYGSRNQGRMLSVSEKDISVKGFIVEDTLIIKLEIILDS